MWADSRDSSRILRMIFLSVFRADLLIKAYTPKAQRREAKLPNIRMRTSENSLPQRNGNSRHNYQKRNHFMHLEIGKRLMTNCEVFL